MTVKSREEINRRARNILTIHFTTIFSNPVLQLFRCLANIPNITGRSKNEIIITPVLSGNEIFKRSEFKFVDSLTEDFVAET